MHQHLWAGLRVASTLPLHDLAPAPVQGGSGFSAADVRIEIGAVPAHLPNPAWSDRRQEVSDGRYLFRRDGVARFLVEAGQVVRIEPEADMDESSLAAFLLGRPFAALACQRGWLSLHGGCVQTATGGVVVTAPAGTGKSTMLAALQARGLRLVSDDASVVRFEEGVPMIWPTSQRVRLRPDAAQCFPEQCIGAPPVRQGIDKVAVHFLCSAPEPVPLRRVMVLSRSGDITSRRPMSAPEALHQLRQHLNRPFLAGIILGESALFAATAALVARVECHRLQVADDLSRLMEAAELVAAP